MSVEPSGGGEYWVVSFLVVSKEGIRPVIKSEEAAKVALWNLDDVAVPVVSRVERLGDTGDAEQERWARALDD